MGTALGKLCSILWVINTAHPHLLEHWNNWRGTLCTQQTSGSLWVQVQLGIHSKTLPPKTSGKVSSSSTPLTVGLHFQTRLSVQHILGALILWWLFLVVSLITSGILWNSEMKGTFCFSREACLIHVIAYTSLKTQLVGLRDTTEGFSPWVLPPITLNAPLRNCTEKELSFSLSRAKAPWTHKVGFVLLLSPLLQSLLLLSLALQSAATCFWL